MEGAVNDFFEKGMNWDRMLEINNWRMQLRLVVLHMDWLILHGWDLPEGVDIDYWRRKAFSD